MKYLKLAFVTQIKCVCVCVRGGGIKLNCIASNGCLPYFSHIIIFKYLEGVMSTLPGKGGGGGTFVIFSVVFFCFSQYQEYLRI